jgi:AGZA family xanthine/uracil permease-like MFS transporter
MAQQSLEPRTVADDAGAGTRVPAGRSWLDRYFHRSLRGSSVAREVRGGVLAAIFLVFFALNPIESWMGVH